MVPGREVRRARELLGLNATQLAAVLAVHPTTVSRWEHDHAAPEGAALILLAALTDRAGDVPGLVTPEVWASAGRHLLKVLRRDGSLCALAEMARFACGIIQP